MEITASSTGPAPWHGVRTGLFHSNSERNEMMNMALKTGMLSLFGFAAMQGAHAQQGGRITFQGIITSVTCMVATADRDKLVPMGLVDAHEFRKPGDARGRQGFSLRLEGCPDATDGQPRRASVRFSGLDINAQTSHLNLLQAGQGRAASGVEVRILNASGEKVLLASGPADQRSTSIALRGDRNRLDFSADYVAVTLPVTSGQADAAVNFEISYP